MIIIFRWPEGDRDDDDAYAAIVRSGLSFPHQLWLRPEILPALRQLTDDIHATGAAASIQIGHCGNMSHKGICGCTPISASSGFNIYRRRWCEE